MEPYGHASNNGTEAALNIGIRLMRIGLCSFLFCTAGLAQKDLADLSMEDLSNIQVTSASKKPEKLSEAPAAIYVLTGEDMRRSGFTNLPDALRVVPGLYVAQTNSHTWQISTRGFSDLNNNKMLVLVDGRSMYTPEFGSVFWDVLDLPLEDIDRVEIIRGPGGTLWGANAVNGVINIVTKNANETQGTMVSSSADPEEGYTTTVQYGGRIGSSLSYRIYGRASYGEPLHAPTGGDLPDHIGMPQAGVRVDWIASANDVLTLEAGAFDGRFRSTQLRDSTIAVTELLKGNHVVLHWKHTISDRSTTETLAYCDWYARFGAPGEMRNTCNLEFQHSYQFNRRHSLIWGGSFFTTGDDLTPDAASYSPERRRNNVVSGFAQYEVIVIPDRLRILAGSKLDHNGYTGVEYQPQIRAIWTPNKVHTGWASISRAVRAPARNTSDLQLFLPVGQSNGLPVFFDIRGDPNLEAEKLKAYEIGYRYQPKQTLSFDLALYYNDYHSLITLQQPVMEILPSEIIFHQRFINGPAAETHGSELSTKWRPFSRWVLSAGITELRGSVDAVQASPHHIFNLQSHVDLPHKFEFDSALYGYGAVPLGGTPPQPIQSVPAYQRVDVGLAWHPGPEWTFAVGGRNLQAERHRETRDTAFGNQAGEVARAVVFRLMWQSKPEKTGPKS
jgi:iron complex outermembrane receptor protein